LSGGERRHRGEVVGLERVTESEQQAEARESEKAGTHGGPQFSLFYMKKHGTRPDRSFRTAGARCGARALRSRERPGRRHPRKHPQRLPPARLRNPQPRQRAPGGGVHRPALRRGRQPGLRGQPPGGPGGRRPALTHTYFMAGSEECGLVGLTSQILLALGLQAANLALTQQDWLYGALAVALAPLASYRFGVSGSREYVKTLSADELRRIRGVVSIDSVGEGRLYIPRGTMGADFLHVLIPFGDYDSINDLLEEAAHLHGIKYNNFLAGGTTDHVSFLEVNNGLWSRARDAVRRAAARLTGRRYTPPLRIPATALVAMVPGKASPIVFGGKIHTPRDTPDRVYPEPLRETLLILDYFFHRLEGRARGRAALPRRVPLRAAVPC